MASNVENESSPRLLIAGDSRIKRLRSSPCTRFSQYEVEYLIENGVKIEALIEQVDIALTPDHAVLIILAFFGDDTRLERHQVTTSTSVTLVRDQVGHPATRVLELAATAHTRWQEARPDRIIVWTLPYYADLVTYNSFRYQSPLPADLISLSLTASQRVVHFIDQLRCKWKNIMPVGALYRHLNDVLFHGDNETLLDTFHFISSHYVFPEGWLTDGLHPTPKLSEKIWRCLERAVQHRPAIVSGPSTNLHIPITAPPAEDTGLIPPTRQIKQLSLSDRLGNFSTSRSLPDSSSKKWKGKGKGKTFQSKPYAKHQSPATSSGYGNNTYHAQSGPPPSTYNYPPSNPFNVPFYPAFPPKLIEPAPSLAYTILPESPPDEDQEEVTDRFGNVSWKAKAVVPFNPLGTINYSSPHEWSWASHIKEINRVQARCHTASIAHQTLARTHVANMMRERGMQEIRTGLNSSFNASASMWGHRIMYGMSYPAPQHTHVEQDAVGLLPPPGYQQYPAHTPFQTPGQSQPPVYQYPAYTQRPPQP